ncbi:MAG: hypothetical protein HQK82_11205 [Desulfovibrionaceae bacterium]|nr:hypothetical protein [Desulfovibrionaceae bacterium]
MDDDDLQEMAAFHPNVPILVSDAYAFDQLMKAIERAAELLCRAGIGTNEHSQGVELRRQAAMCAPIGERLAVADQSEALADELRRSVYHLKQTLPAIGDGELREKVMGAIDQAQAKADAVEPAGRVLYREGAGQVVPFRRPETGEEK